MKTSFFRKASVDQINSPEQLNSYIRVTNPGVWLILGAVIALLIGTIIWGAFGTIETTLDIGVMVNDDSALCYVTEDNAPRLMANQPVTVQGVTGHVLQVAQTPVQADASWDAYLLHLNGVEAGTFCYEVTLDVDGLTPGVYPAKVTIDSVHPLSFVTR